MTYVFTCTRPLYAVVPLCNLKTFLPPSDPYATCQLLLHTVYRRLCMPEDALSASGPLPQSLSSYCRFLIHIRMNFPRRIGSLRIAIHEFSMRVALMNPGPIPVILPFQVVSPVEYSPASVPRNRLFSLERSWLSRRLFCTAPYGRADGGMP